MPDPSNYASREDFLAACVPMMVDEGKPQDQAVAACSSMWEDRAKAAPDRVRKAYETTHRAFTRLDIKAIDDERREIKGVATTPTVDRIGDVVEPLGAQFDVPMMLLLDHEHRDTVGHVEFAKPTKNGIGFTARIVKFDEPGEVKTLVDKAWHLVKTKLRSFVSIGFRALPNGIELMEDGGLRYKKWEWLELSLVAIPANREAVILEAKSMDAAVREITSIDQRLQASSQAERAGSRASGAAKETREAPSSGSRKAPVVTLTRKEREMTITEQIKAFRDERAAKSARRMALMEESATKGETLDDEQGEEYETLDREIKAIDKHLKRLEGLEVEMQARAVPVMAKSIEDGSAARSPQIRVQAPQMPPGVRLARVARCLALAQGNRTEALAIGKRTYASDAPTIATLEAAVMFGEVSDLAVKAAVPAGSTTDTQWAGALVSAASGEAGVVGDFVEYLRPMTIIGKFGAGGIPALNRVPFRTGLITQHTGGTGYWVGEGAPKPVTKVDLSRQTLLPTKCATIAVVTDELLRDSSPSADILVRNSLVGALTELMDSDFVDPASTASGARPASITNGVTAIASQSAGGSEGGGTAEAVRADVKALFGAFIAANLLPNVWIMRATTALALSQMYNPLGNKEFPTISVAGGTFEGLPVIVSQHVPAVGSPTGDYVILMDSNSVWFADEGGLSIDMSREASLIMADAVTGAAFTGSPGSVTALDPTQGMVSLWQQNLIAWRAERTINWRRARQVGVQVLESANWGL